MNSALVWFTGLPRSGKSTLAAKVAAGLREAGHACVVLDGDEVRSALVPAPGYGPAQRDAFYATLAQLAALIQRQGLTVLVAATAHRRAYRDAARALATAFLEVFVDTPLSECVARDQAGLYVSAGTRSQLPGAGVSYEPPLAPDVVAHGGCDQDALQAIVRWIGQERAPVAPRAPGQR